MTRVLLITVSLSVAFGLLPADASAQGLGKNHDKGEEPKLVAIYRFYDKKLSQHIYTYSETELAAWREDPEKKEEKTIGYGSLTEVPETHRLWRARRLFRRFPGDPAAEKPILTERHCYYLQASNSFEGQIDKDFVVYVWTKNAEGRLPIRGSCLPDGTDLFMDPDAKQVKKVLEDAFTGSAVKRIAFPTAFYLREGPPREKNGPDGLDGGGAETKLVALHRFFDSKLSQHLYAYGNAELVAWRRDPEKKEEKTIGYASLNEIPGTRRLWRAADEVRLDGKRYPRHYYYLQAVPYTGFHETAVVVDKDFVVYVWTHKGEGRVPVHGCCMPDRTDMFIDPDAKQVKKAVEETLAGFAARRTVYPAAFYLYETAQHEKAKPDGPKK